MDEDDVEDDNDCGYPEEAKDTGEVGRPVACTDEGMVDAREVGKVPSDTEDAARAELDVIELTSEMV
jgi:hypothetical protein